MSKEFAFDQVARDKIMNGVNVLAKAVGSSLGPKGRSTLIQKSYGAPHLTKDGVSIARETILEDPFENMGAEIVKQSAEKTVSQCGDGTTSTTILAQKLIEGGFKLVAAGHAPIDLKRGIDLAVNKVVEELNQASKPVSSSKEIEQVGTISANGDTDIGKMIATAIDQVGSSGVITLEEGKGVNTELNVVNGYQWDKGYLSQHFATNEKLEAVLENPLILLTDNSINNQSVIIPIMERVQKVAQGRPLLVVAKNVEGDALPVLVINHLRRSFASCCVRAGGFGDRQIEMLQDLAILTGATLVSETIGLKLENFDASWLGEAKRVLVNSNSTTVIEGMGNPEEIENRVAKIRSAMDQATSDWDREKQEERLAKLVGGVAVISVGAPTEAEMKEKKDRYDDALGSTKAAVKEGIVAGGGVALLRASKVLDGFKVAPELQHGVELVRKALKEPLRKIVLNAGGEPAEVMLGVLQNPNPNWGYNVATEQFQDLVENGVIDPTLVVKASLINSASVAGILLTTECMIVNKPKKEAVPQQMME